MGKYGDVAVQAVRAAVSSGDPKQAWKRIVKTAFPDSPSAQAKACPKSAFLGLCEEGLVLGVKPGRYTRSVDNKAYAVNAVKQLKRDSALAADRDRLWKLAINGADKVENQQMDVVISLWRNHLID